MCTGNVFAVYGAKERDQDFRLGIRSSGKDGKWGQIYMLPSGSHAYQITATPDGKVHFLYGQNGGVWHNWAALKVNYTLSK